MKKKMWLGLATLSILFVLGACGSQLPKAEDAVSAMINSEVYDKDDEKYEEYFHLKLESPETVFKDVADEFVALGMPAESADELVDKLVTQVRENTSYEIVKSEEKDKITTVTVNVYGIDVTGFEENIEEITNEEVVNSLKALGLDIENLDNLDEFAESLSEADFEKFADHFNNFDEGEILSTVMFKAIEGLKKSETPSEYQVMLKVNKDNKNAWEIVNHELTVTQLGTLLFNFE